MPKHIKTAWNQDEPVPDPLADFDAESSQQGPEEKDPWAYPHTIHWCERLEKGRSPVPITRVYMVKNHFVTIVFDVKRREVSAQYRNIMAAFQMPEWVFHPHSQMIAWARIKTYEELLAMATRIPLDGRMFRGSPVDINWGFHIMLMGVWRGARVYARGVACAQRAGLPYPENLWQRGPANKRPRTVARFWPMLPIPGADHLNAWARETMAPIEGDPSQLALSFPDYVVGYEPLFREALPPLKQLPGAVQAADGQTWVPEEMLPRAGTEMIKALMLRENEPPDPLAP